MTMNFFRRMTGLMKAGIEPCLKRLRRTASKKLSWPSSRKNPFVLSTTPQDKLLESNRAGWKATLIIALVPLGLDVLLLWLRYKS